MMKINRLGLAAVLAAAATLHANAAPLTQTAAVHAKPDTSAPVLSLLDSGTEPTPAASVDAPAGWMAVELPGPHEVFVQNKDIQKNLDVKPGAALHKEPKSDSPVLATAAAGDATEITGLRGRWTQLRLNKTLTGYIQVSAAPAPAPAATPAAEKPTDASAPSPATPTSTATPAPAPVTAAGRPVPMDNRGDGGISALPRLFQGKLTSTRHPLRPRRPYDYQLVDDGGDRYAYIDITKLLLTEQIEKYIDRTVVVYGPAKPVAGTKDIVIQVESLQLR